MADLLRPRPYFPRDPEIQVQNHNSSGSRMGFIKQRFVPSTAEQTSFLLFFFRTVFFIDGFLKHEEREKLNWQDTFPADALCAYSTVSLPVSISSLRLAIGVSLFTGVGNSSYCT